MPKNKIKALTRSDRFAIDFEGGTNNMYFLFACADCEEALLTLRENAHRRLPPSVNLGMV